MRLPRAYQLTLYVLSLSVVGTLLWYSQQSDVVTDLIHEPRLLLWWTSATRRPVTERICGSQTCRFTTDRRLLFEAKVVLFEGNLVRAYDWPLPRYDWQLWALIDPPNHMHFLQQATVLQHFNFSSTFSRHSNFPHPLRYLPNFRQLIDKQYCLDSYTKNKLRTSLAPILFVQSHCGAHSANEDYVRTLMTYIPIDAYGACAKNRELPKNLQSDQQRKPYDWLRFMAHYKFVLGIENAICDDYITDAYWQPLTVGAVPIYFGAPNIRDWEPHDRAAIYIADFEGPRQLAAFVQALDNNDSAYMQYLRHKEHKAEPVTNARLVNHMLYRRYGGKNADLNELFECYMCRMIHRLERGVRYEVTTAHSNCWPAAQLSKSKRVLEDTKAWQNIAHEAKVLDKLLRANVSYTREQFDELLQSYNHSTE